jgi:predicted MFS family arabinose efflux permease/transcriptional regulator with XRE-family HTH domain
VARHLVDAGLPPAVVARHQLAEELRTLRLGLGLVAREVVGDIGFSVAKLSRIETGRCRVQQSDLKELLRVYHADEATTQRLLQLARAATGSGVIPIPDIPAPTPADTATAPSRPELRAALLVRWAQVTARGEPHHPGRHVTAHARWLDQVIEWHGWPGYTAVGHDGAHAAVMILMRADPQTRARHLPLLTGAVLAGEADPYHLACVLDHHLLETGRPQLFGTHYTLLGDQLARVALVILVYTRTGSAPAAAAGYAVTLLPALLGGPILARLADRYPRRTVMIACDLASAALIAATALPGLPVAAILAVAFAAGVVGVPFEAARAATIPVLLPAQPEQYAAATTVMALTVRASQILGYAGGGLIAATLGPRTALLADAATFALSAAITRIGLAQRPATRLDQRHGQWADLRAGLRLVFGNPDLRTPVLYGWLAGIYVAPGAVVAPLARQHGGGSIAVGALLTAWSGGSAVTVIIFGRWLRDPTHRHRLLAPLALLNGATLALSVFRPGLAGTAILWTAAGAAASYQLIADVWFMTAAPDDRRGQAFGIATTGILAGQGAGLLAAGALAQDHDPSLVVAAFGAAGALATLTLAAFNSRPR